MEKLKEYSLTARKQILKMKCISKSSHIGSAFSVIDILIYLYFRKANISDENISDIYRDKIILSKGHASAALYTTLWLKGFITDEQINNYYCDNGALPGHVDKTVSKALDLSSGSLGHGLSVAAGMGLSFKMNKLNHKIYIILGDGELNEGSIWEAAMFISSKNLDNVVIIIDSNKLQGYDLTENILEYEKMKKMWLALKFEVKEINGNSFEDLEKGLSNLSGKPEVIIANTIKGKGIKDIENKLEWHYKSPNENEYKIWLKELEDKNENNIY
ncbi:MAG: transketolase [Cetobacterium sp.]|uniref:transketolase n=1 Tax=Cetobacterium sp. TaxID=2071632 RepID=UPI002FCC2384